MHAAVVYKAAAAQEGAERGLPDDAGAGGLMLKLLPPFEFINSFLKSILHPLQSVTQFVTYTSKHSPY
jgi:hypothetical protein